MIHLTTVQGEVLQALFHISNGERPWRSTANIYQQRIANRSVQDARLLRTTEESLKKLAAHVPQLVTSNAMMWRLTSAGKIVAETQLQREVR